MSFYDYEFLCVDCGESFDVPTKNDADEPEIGYVAELACPICYSTAIELQPCTETAIEAIERLSARMIRYLSRDDAIKTPHVVLHCRSLAREVYRLSADINKEWSR